MNLQSIGFAILKHRRLAKLTQYELAGRSGVSVSTIRRTEQGTHAAGADVLARVAKGLNLSMAQLLSDVDTATNDLNGLNVERRSGDDRRHAAEVR